MLNGRVVPVVQQRKLRQHHLGVDHRLVRRLPQPLGLAQRILRLDFVAGPHVRPTQPRKRPSLRVWARHGAGQVGENLLGLGVVALHVVGLANDPVVVVDPLVQNRTLERLSVAAGRRHGVAVHHSRALFDGPFHQREDLLGRFLVRLQEQRQGLVPAFAVHLLELDVCLLQRLVGVEIPVVSGGGVVEHPVRPAIALRGARHQRCQGNDENNKGTGVSHKLQINVGGSKILDARLWLARNLFNCRYSQHVKVAPPVQNHRVRRGHLFGGARGSNHAPSFGGGCCGRGGGDCRRCLRDCGPNPASGTRRPRLRVRPNQARNDPSATTRRQRVALAGAEQPRGGGDEARAFGRFHGHGVFALGRVFKLG